MNNDPQIKPTYLSLSTRGVPRQLACVTIASADPNKIGFLWFPGLQSTMTSTKASVLASWSRDLGRAFTAFDYFGHGRSDGTMRDGTVSLWLDDAMEVMLRLTHGPIIFVGSSMGAWIALLLLRRLRRTAPEEADRVKGTVLIAPAWDMTEALMWEKFSPEVRREVEEKGEHLLASDYDEEPYPITRQLIEDGRDNLLVNESFDPGCPVRLLHGQRDTAVPWHHSVHLMDLLQSDDVVLTLIKDGDHRLSRPEDLSRLTIQFVELLARIEPTI